MGDRSRGQGPHRACDRGPRLFRKARGGGIIARPVRNNHRQDARLSRPGFCGGRLFVSLPRGFAVFCFSEPLMKGLPFALALLLAGGLVLVSFMLLYKNRLYSLLNVF